MTIEWRQVEAFPAYEVSNDGRVRRGKKFLKPYVNVKTGYVEVRLCDSGQVIHKAVHRLVAGAFVDNPGNKRVVNHKDYDRTNNRANNLEWVTVQENVQHSAVHMHGSRNTRPGASGLKYVYLKRGGSYRVYIRGRYYGTFKTKDEAQKARDKACDLLFSRSAGSIAIYAADRPQIRTTFSAPL